MTTQQAITGFTVRTDPPDTPKRKRATSKSKDTAEAFSPSQASPEHKTGRATEDRSTKHMDTSPLPASSLKKVKDDVKRKTRGRASVVDEVARATTPTQEKLSAADIPLPPSPTEKRSDREPQGIPKEMKLQRKQRELSPQRRDHSEQLARADSPSPTGYDKIAKSLKAAGISKPSALKKTTFAKSVLKKMTPILPQWKARRVVVTCAIKLPKTKAKRTEYLSRELNKFLIAAKKVTPNNRAVYVRRFKDHETLSDTERNYWIDSFGATQMSHLMDYTNGFWANQVLRDGTFRLTLQLVVPITTEIVSFLDNLNGLWSDNNKMVRDCQEQSLYNPKTIGWLLRSNWHMTSSDELQRTLDKIGGARYPGLVFGVTFKTIPSPGPKPQKYDKETAIRAVVISTNAEYLIPAWETMFKIYNTVNPKYPLNIAMHFVPTKDHPDIRNNPVAVQNITLLMDRQRMFLKNTFTLQCHALADPDREVPSGGTLRDKLSALTARTMGEKVKGAKLFHAISQRFRDGTNTYFMTYHRAVEREATSIISGMGAFMKNELSLDPDLYCFPIHVNPDHSWDPITRTTKNSTINFLTSLVADTSDIHAEETEEEVREEEQEFEMGSKAEREFQRIAGLDDAETVADLAKRKTAKPKPVPRQISSDDRSTKSELSGLTNYSSESKMSQHRKELRKMVDNKDMQLLEQTKQLEELRRQMEELQRAPDKRAQEDTTHPATTNNAKDGASGKLDPSPQGRTQQPPHQEAYLFEDDKAPAHKWKDEEQLPDGSEKDSQGRPLFSIDPDGTVWEIGWDIPLDKREGDTSDPESDWFQVTSGAEIPARAYARHLQDEGHEVILSRTGLVEGKPFVVYVVVNSEEEEEQGSGENTGAEAMEIIEETQKVQFATNTEVQRYDPESMSLEEGNQIQQTKGKATQEEFSDSSASSKSSKSSLSQASSQSASESLSASSSKEEAVQVKEGNTPPKPWQVPPPLPKQIQKKQNLTKATVEDTKKLINKGLHTATTKVKTKSSSGESPGQDS